MTRPYDRRPTLRADCGRCAGLCCVAPPFSASADFAIDKAGGQRCPNLEEGFRCRIHPTLRVDGFPGCAVFDCFGAGQHLVQVTFGGQTWESDAARARLMFATFPVMRQLHELLWYLSEAATLVDAGGLDAGPLEEEVEALRGEVEGLVGSEPSTLAALDGPGLRKRAGHLLASVSGHARRHVADRSGDRTGADLVGANLAGARLQGVSLRGAYLIGADLRGADLRNTDLLGADLRSADLRGADLTGCLFLTQPQLEAARGDRATRLPAAVSPPAHWRGDPAADARRIRIRGRN